MNHPRVIFLTAFLLSFTATEVFAQSIGSWKKLSPAPSVRTEVAVALLAGKIYLIGGFTPKGVTDKVEAFDLATGTWQAQSPLPRPLHHTTASVVNDKLYVIGGFGSATWTPTNVTYMYDPDTHHWTVKAPMPTERGALSAGVINGKIYAIGGALRKVFRLVNTGANEVYDPETDQWQTLAPVPTPRDHLTISSF